MAATAIQRRSDGTLMPGSRLNPGGAGRQKGLASTVRASMSVTELVDTAVRILRGEPIQVGGPDGHCVIPTMKDIQWAATWLADRGWGLPHQHVSVEQVDTTESFDAGKLDRAQRAELERLLELAAGAETTTPALESPVIEAEIVAETEIK